MLLTDDKEEIMGYSGLCKISGSIGKQYAIRDWNTVARWANENGHADLVEKFTPGPKKGMKGIDRCTRMLVFEMGMTIYDFDIAMAKY